MSIHEFNNCLAKTDDNNALFSTLRKLRQLDHHEESSQGEECAVFFKKQPPWM